MNQSTNVLFITGVGGLGDYGYNDEGFAGVQRAIKELGVKLDIVELNKIADLSETIYLSGAAKKKYAVIVALGFYQGDAANAAAKKISDQKMIIIDALSSEPNVKGVLFREEENAFLAGMLAAHVTQGKVIGIILGVDAPHVNRYAFAYEAGARTVHYDVKVLVDTVGDFRDRERGKQLSLSQINRGADVIYQVAGRAGLGVFDAAEEKEIYAIGEGLNQNKLRPEFIIASTYKRMDLAIFEAIHDALENTFTGGNFSYGFDNNYLEFSLEDSLVPIAEKVKRDLLKYRQKLARNEIKAPTNQQELIGYFKTIV